MFDSMAALIMENLLVPTSDRLFLENGTSVEISHETSYKTYAVFGYAELASTICSHLLDTVLLQHFWCPHIETRKVTTHHGSDCQ
jgi:hypothetical protein